MFSFYIIILLNCKIERESCDRFSKNSLPFFTMTILIKIHKLIRCYRSSVCNVLQSSRLTTNLSQFPLQFSDSSAYLSRRFRYVHFRVVTNSFVESFLQRPFFQRISSPPTEQWKRVLETSLNDHHSVSWNVADIFLFSFFRLRLKHYDCKRINSSCRVKPTRVAQFRTIITVALSRENHLTRPFGHTAVLRPM